jgi:hypothetical protein
MAVVTPPLFMDVSSFYSGDELGLPHRDIVSEGVCGATDLAVTQNGAGDLSVNVAAGACWVKGDDDANAQPTYRCRASSVTNLAVAADPSNPRKALVIAEVIDATFSGASRLWQLRVVLGTPAGSPAEPALPPNALQLAMLTIAAGDTAITTGEITDRRTRAYLGTAGVGLTQTQPTDGQVPVWNAGQSLYIPGAASSSFPVPIDLRNPQTAANAGNCFPTVTALTDWEEWHWEFVKDVDGKLYGVVRVPWTPTACKIVLHTLYNATTGVARWSVSWLGAADGVTFNPAALTSLTSQDITVPGTARLRKDVTFTLGSQPVNGDVLMVEVYHEGVHANDTVAVNSELLGATLLPS